jgi:polyisoprenoid-binding protein YceI
MKRTIWLSMCAFVAVLNLQAQPTTWVVDKAHSKVQFTVSHLVIAEVTGWFTEFDAKLVQTKEDFTTSRIEATIKTASIDTDEPNRDKHLRSDEFLSTEKFPEMIFRSTSVEKTGKDTYRVTGNLTIRDITKSIVLDTRFNGTVKDPWGNLKAGFKATTTINRFEFGTTWKMALDTGGLVAGENVDITLLLEFARQK